MSLVTHDIANWLDEQKRISNQALDEVIKNPGDLGFLVVASAYFVKGSMFVGSGFWDVLKLGQGVAAGGVGGFVSDGLRLVSVIPGAGTAVKAGGTAVKSSAVVFRNLTQAKSAATSLAPGIYTGGRIAPALDSQLVKHIVVEGAKANGCTLVATSRAIAAQAGGTSFKGYLTAGQLAARVGAAAFVTVDQVVDVLRAQGLTANLVKAVPKFGSARDAASILKQSMKNPEDVAILSVVWDSSKAASSVGWVPKKGDALAHTVLAYFDQGRLKIIDQMADRAMEFDGLNDVWAAFMQRGSNIRPDLSSLAIWDHVVVEQVKVLGAKSVNDLLPGLTALGLATASGTQALIQQMTTMPGTGPGASSQIPLAPGSMMISRNMLHQLALPVSTINVFDRATATKRLQTKIKR
jgi:hypothetical protein